MRRNTIVSVAGLSVITFAVTLLGQVRNENLANDIIAARKKDAAMLQQFSWNSRVELLKGDHVEDVRIDAVSTGPDGKLQRTVMNDQPSQPMPRGFLRRRVADEKKQETEEYLKGLSALLDQYTLPSAGKVIDFIAGAQVQPSTSPQGKTVLTISGNGVITPGDSFTLTIDGATMKTQQVQITTTYNGDAATAHATFVTGPKGLNHLRFAEISVPAKNVTIQVHNFDYVPNQ